MQIQEDFPCLEVGQGPYEMNIENNDFRQPRQENRNPIHLNSFSQSLKEGEMSHDKKAIIQLDNSIKLSLQIKMFKEDTQSKPVSSYQGTQNLRGLHQNEISESNLNTLSLSSKFLHENDKITSIITVQIQQETFNIVNEMFLTNQLEKNNQDFCNLKLPEKVLTQQNLLSLPDDSGKRNQKFDIQQMRKISDNSNYSDTTQPWVSNITQNIPNCLTYRCYKCGVDNSISISESIKTYQELFTNSRCDKQSDINLQSQNKIIQNQDNNGIFQEKIKQQNYLQDSASEIQQLNTSKKQKKQIEMDMQQPTNQQKQNKNKSIPNNSRSKNNMMIELSTQKKNKKSLERNNKYTLNQKEINSEQNLNTYKNKSITSIQSFDNSNKEEINNGIQFEDKSFLCIENLISTAQYMQSESSYNSSFNQQNQSEIDKVKTQTQESQILPRINFDNNLSVFQDNQSSQYIQKQDINSKPISQIQNTDLNIPPNQTLSKNLLQKINTPNFNNDSNIQNTPLIKISPNTSEDYKIIEEINQNQLIPSNNYPLDTIQNSKTQQKQNQKNNIKSIENIQQCSSIQSFDDDVNKNIKQNDFIEVEGFVSDEDKQDYYQNSDEQNEIDMNFTDDTIAKTQKKNVVKNFVKAFKTFVKNNQLLLDKVSSKQTKPMTLQQKFQKFENYINKNNFNNQFVKQLINNSDYSSIFQFFLLNKADEWLKNSNVQNKETHKQMLIFFKKSIDDSNQLNKLRVLKKNKRIPNSNNNKIQSTPSTTSSSGLIQIQQGIGPFSVKELDQTDIIQSDQTQQNKTEICPSIVYDDTNSFPEISNQQPEKKNSQKVAISSLNSIQHVLNDIQLNKPSYSIQSQNQQTNS